MSSPTRAESQPPYLARVWLGIVCVALAIVGAAVNAYAQVQSCKLDRLFDNAPVGAGSLSAHHQWPYLGCVAEYGMADGGSVIVMPPFDWTWPLLIEFGVGIALFVSLARPATRTR